MISNIGSNDSTIGSIDKQSVKKTDIGDFSILFMWFYIDFMSSVFRYTMKFY